MDIIMGMINIVIAIDINNYHYGLSNVLYITIIKLILNLVCNMTISITNGSQFQSHKRKVTLIFI